MPDVSGIDKVFDYLVPDSLCDRAWVGAKVRVNLNNRRVGGWIVALHTESDRHDGFEIDRLLPIVSVSGHGVEPDLVALTRWMAETFFGSWRATLASASAPHVRAKTIHPHRGSGREHGVDEVSTSVRRLLVGGGGLVIVPPLGSALSAIAEMAQSGPVLAICPTHKMATLGAASLRRKGLTTAVVPEQWDAARAGVDVVIGARSAVIAPCADLGAIVVIDEHDELLHEERAPTWNAVDVARERARAAQLPLVVTSPIPSAESLHRYNDSLAVARTSQQWPEIEIVDLGEVPVSGSLLSSQLLAAVSNAKNTVACVLNTKGKARLIVCRSCRDVQLCPQCQSLLAQNNDVLLCPRCGDEHGSVCLSCGRTSFVVPRGGMNQLAAQIRTSVGREVIEVSGETGEPWGDGSIYVGTEAVLHRVSRVDVVVFADIDRDLGAPRVTAAREVLALVTRAARLVGDRGRVIIQTRRMDHPVIAALGAQIPLDSVMEWCDSDRQQRHLLSLPPYSRLVRVTVRGPHSLEEIPEIAGVDIARHEDYVLLKSSDHDTLIGAVGALRQLFGTHLGVYCDPVRY